MPAARGNLAQRASLRSGGSMTLTIGNPSGGSADRDDVCGDRPTIGNQADKVKAPSNSLNGDDCARWRRHPDTSRSNIGCGSPQQ